MGAEVKNFVSESQARPGQPERLKIGEIQRLPSLGLTVFVHYDKNGKQKALVVRDHAKPENYREIDTVLQKVRNSRILKAAGLVVGGTGVLAGCVSDNSNANISGTSLGQKSLPMTVNDMNNLGVPQMAAWTQFSDDNLNIAEMDGKKVIVINRDESLLYAECDDFQECLNVPSVQEIAELTPEFGGWDSGGIYRNSAGENKLLFMKTGLSTLIAETSIDRDETGRIRASSSLYAHEPEALTGSFTVNNNGIAPSLIYQGTGPYAHLRNLHTLDDREIPLAQFFMHSCGTPDFSDNAAVASFLGSEWGTEPVVCELITAPTLDELADELLTTESFVESQNSYRPTTPRLTNPRLVGKYLIYARYDRNPATGVMEPRIWYAVVQDYCGDAVCNGTETSADCETDCPPIGPVCGNAICETPDETRAGCPTDCPPVCGDAVCETLEISADCPTDCPPPDPCGDGTCETALGETTETCPVDCPPPDPCGNGTCETVIGETTETCPTDCPPAGDDDDTGDDDTGDDDTGDDDTGNDDTGDDDTGDDDTGDDDTGDDDTGDDDSGDDDTGDDDTGDDDTGDDDMGDDDTIGDDDIVADPCAFAEGRVRELTEGCAKTCADPLLTLDGTCVVEMGVAPNISQITLQDAIYSIDVEEGSAYLIGGGSVSITDSGYELDSVYGDFVVGVTGTQYEMNLDEANQRLTISVAEGSVDVFYKGNKVAILEALPEIPAVMEFNTNTGEIIEPPTEVIGCPEDPRKCPPDRPKPKPEPKGCGGCESTTPQTAGLWALMLAAISGTRRRIRTLVKN